MHKLTDARHERPVLVAPTEARDCDRHDRATGIERETERAAVKMAGRLGLGLALALGADQKRRAGGEDLLAFLAESPASLAARLDERLLAHRLQARLDGRHDDRRELAIEDVVAELGARALAHDTHGALAATLPDQAASEGRIKREMVAVRQHVVFRALHVIDDENVAAALGESF